MSTYWGFSYSQVTQLTRVHLQKVIEKFFSTSIKNSHSAWSLEQSETSTTTFRTECLKSQVQKSVQEKKHLDKIVVLLKSNHKKRALFSTLQVEEPSKAKITEEGTKCEEIVEKYVKGLTYLK
jgi:hypothetical protein